ncbi:hypothetical protein EV699_10376 [Plasticicumulans lactativorans]|uniref:AAA+ ATPase domain-containing protein n=1 Tax=Plasticicumulans lactativorans TaxID=1133106 RepID=A0A4R2L7S3_9GAMM|nr:helicase HerA-like domain-containing protein [Plasticicumulans lactativorans]TCO83031.1 hypothetical protein EV699_10376 [Plasticicumulans lactativorans]
MPPAPDTLPFARGAHEIALLARMANRHGLIAGATGTGKTVTLRTLAEQFSALGVPVFLADVKGDLSGLAEAGGDSPRVRERLADFGMSEADFAPCPVVFWDVFGDSGLPVRATVSDMGPLLLGRLLGLNDTQAGVLTMVFRIADDNGLLLLDLKDLRAMVQYVGDHAAEFRTQYGNVSAASIGAIQRGLLQLEHEGAERFFGEPALDLDDLIQTEDGAGVVNILVADQLMHAPRLYGTFLLWLLAELFERLPEAGDLDRPRLVFFFDEAHLLFDDAPKVLVDKVEQVVRLIRSKGVGVYFVTQNPLDLPETVLGQLGNRVQHALRAFTPRDQKAVRAAAETFRSNPGLDVARAIGELGVGEALVSVLDARGTPTPVERAYIRPPRTRLAPLDAAARDARVRASPLHGHYAQAIDRESAYEMLAGHGGGAAGGESGGGLLGGVFDTVKDSVLGEASGGLLGGGGNPRGRAAAASPLGGIVEAMAKSAARSIGSSVGRQIVRGVLGSLFGGGGRRR